MKKFAQFFNKSANPDNKTLIPACGSDSVYEIDRRLSDRNAVMMANLVCKQRGYLGFTLNQGESYSRSREIRTLEVI